MTVTTQLDATPERVWQLWADPRQLERWWGPPGWPATFTEHDLGPESTVRYHMTGPDGEQPKGMWRIVKVDPPHRLVFEDSFEDEDGGMVEHLATIADVVIEEHQGGTRMVIESRFASTEAMEELLEMGMEHGLAAALDQIDGILTETAA
jgi:uncharacterized protein YndB with AHSA1/START domain